MTIIDISQPLRAGMPVWPGDRPFEPRWSARIAEGSSVNVGAVTLSLHTGTHADAPLHVSDDGASIDAMPLAAYIGPAVVVEAIGTGGIGPEAVAGLDLKRTPRVLFKTRRQQHPERWEDDFAYITPELARLLVAEGVVLVGLDTPSVDSVNSKTLDTHHILFGGSVANLENLDLHRAELGDYTLVALPISIQGMDGGPVRAILLKDTYALA